MVDRNRLRKPTRIGDYGPDPFVCHDNSGFSTYGEDVLITDPNNLADLFDSEDPIACFVWEHGVIIDDFGGDVCCPVWWSAPYLLLPLISSDSSDETPEGFEILAEQVGCDCGSFVFLPLTMDVPPDLQRQISRIVAANYGAVIPMPAGRWTVWYEGGEDAQIHTSKIVILCEEMYSITPAKQLELDF